MVEFFGNIHVDWLGKRKLFFALTTILIVIGAVSLITKGGFRYGVDFQGGTIVQVKFSEKTDIGKIREAVPTAEIQALLSGQNEFLMEYKGANDESGDASRGREAITQALNKSFAGKFEIRGATSVGPKVGHDLRQQAVFATLYALGGMLVYIAFRFEWIYGVAAVFAALHDTLITLGMFSLFHYPINLTVIAALLTLVGYSMNDTIVVFDRVRENLKIRRRDDLGTVMNDSINQTLSRTILTSGLTFLSVLALFIFGGEIINQFAFAMVIGIIIGTYSSIAIASPLVLIYSNLKGTFARQPVSTAKVPNKVPKPAKAK
jgi:preprotein translocase subunit SecF